MPKDHFTGTGSTRRHRRSYSTSDPLDEATLRETLKSWAATGDPFIAKLERIEQGCRRILDDASLPYDAKALITGTANGQEDTPTSYALRALNMLRFLRQFLAEGDARIAADFAFDLGILLAEAGMKPLADPAFAWTLGKAKVAAARRDRDSEIRKIFEAKLASGIARKAAIADLKEEFNLGDRQLRTIIPRARRK